MSKEVVLQEVIMNIRKYQNIDKNSLINLWKGIQLIKYAIKFLKALGCKKVNLQIRATNTAVADFYKSLGFTTEDRLSMGTFI